MTERLAAENGGPILCLAASAYGREFRLHASRPGPEMNSRVTRHAKQTLSMSGTSVQLQPEPKPAPLTIVRIDGPIEQRSGYHDMCGGWSDGHDAIAERLTAAFEDGDVLLVVDSPGGAAAGLQEAVNRVVAAKGDRRVTVYADEMIGSAAYWWAACVGDEIYAPAAGQVGSIGARSGHASIAGALEKEGVAVTFFCWPDEGKVAFAPELPLSDVGRARGERDVRACGEAFASAVAPRRGMTMAKIKALRADVLSGQSAVSAKLIDGVAGFDDVLEYALTLATAGEDMDPKDVIAKPGVAAAAPEQGDDDAPPPADKRECASCSAANDDVSKYCKMCGAEMPGMSADADGDNDGDTSAAAPEPENSTPPADEKRTTAEILGLRSDASALAVKSAVIKLTSVVSAAMKATDTSTPDAMVGAVIAQAGDAKRLSQVEADNRSLRKTAASAERMALLRKLSSANLPGFARGDLFIDKVDDNGRRTTIPTPMFADMKLSSLREFVDRKISTGTPSRATPFEPDPAQSATTAPTDVDQEVARKTGQDPKRIAASRAAIMKMNQATNTGA